MELNTSTYRTLVSNEDVWLYMHVIDNETMYLKTYGLSYFPDTGFEWDGRVDDVLEEETNEGDVFWDDGVDERPFTEAADDALDNFIGELDCPPILAGEDGQLFCENLLPTGHRFSAYLVFEYEP